MASPDSSREWLRLKTPWRSTTMIFDYSLAAIVSAGLLFYLTYALLRPERF
jgi:K+-transporting ATPase KdpF subunit